MGFRRSGLTLSEVLISLGLLAASTVVALNLLQATLVASGRTDATVEATLLAEDALNRARALVAERGISASLQPLSLRRGQFTVRVRGEPHAIYTPCREFESLFPETERRALRASVLRVEVDVSWGRRTVGLCALVAPPPTRLGEVAVRKQRQGVFTASAYGPNHGTLADCFFHWYSLPPGRMEVSRDGRRVRVQGTDLRRLTLRCVYGGVERSRSVEVTP
ncbi:MAG: hypothetical protein AB1758_07475 [Candidatus Eremiobacterota bacterium]